MALAASVDYPTSGPEQDTEESYWPLEKCKKAYRDYLWLKRDEINEQKESRRYRHGVQWTKKEINTLNSRGQPVITFNRIGRKIDAITGLVERLKQDPKAFPKTPRPTDEQGAELATAALRHVVEEDLKEDFFSTCADSAAVNGMAGIELILVEGPNGDPELSFKDIDIEDFFYDPRCFKPDFSDSRYSGIGKWVDENEAISLMPECEEDIKGSFTTGTELSSDSDREVKWFFHDTTSRRLRLVEIWYKHNGSWCWAIFTGSKVLMEGRGYFFDRNKKVITKYHMFSCYVDQDGDRYGFNRNLKGPQDEINHRRTRALFELVSRQMKAEDGAFSDIEEARKQRQRPDGMVIYNKGFEVDFDDPARLTNVQGQIQMGEEAKNEIENFGPNPALIGQGLEYKSGRAINLLQQAGMAELGPFLKNYKNWKLRLYRSIWTNIQHYWKRERWIRIVAPDEETSQWLEINSLQVDPMTGTPIIINKIADLDVNITIDEGPDEINMMADAYDTLLAMAQQGANVPPPVLIELAPLSYSKKKKLMAMLQQPDPAAVAAKQQEAEANQAGIEETKSRTALNMAKAQKEAQPDVSKLVDAAGKREQNQAKLETEQQKRNSMVLKNILEAKRDERKTFMDLQSHALKMSSKSNGMGGPS